NRLRIQYSIAKGFYFLLEKDLSHDNLLKIEKMMKKTIKRDLPIKKAIYSKREALKIFKNSGLQDKIVLLENISKQRIAVYSLLNLYDICAMPQ
ncbi:unnamed protein product, partial [marine sediment metagenome]